MRPLMRDHRVCIVSSINGVLVVINIFLFVVMLIIMSMWAVEYVEVPIGNMIVLTHHLNLGETTHCGRPSMLLRVVGMEPLQL